MSRLPHRRAGRRDPVRRRPCAEDTVRHLLRPEHHAARQGRDRKLGRGRFRARDARRPPPGWRELLSRVPVSVVHAHHGCEPARPVGLPALAQARRAAEPRARARLLLPLALPGRHLEVAVLRSRSLGCRSSQERRSESRRISGTGPRPLRRVPHAAQFPRRDEEEQVPGRRERHRAESHADAAREKGRRRNQGVPADRDDPGRGRCRGVDGGGGEEHDRPAHAPGPRRRSRLPAFRAPVDGCNQIAWNRARRRLVSPMNEAQRLVDLIPRLRRYARALVGDRATADDLVQDTLERAWAKLHLYRRGTDLRAWLFTVMHNVHVNRVRATRVTDTLDDEMPELAQRAPQGDALLVRDLDRAIARLPSEQRAVLLLVTLEEMSYDQVARTLGIPIGTVMSRLSRAREKLRALMLGQPASTKLKVVK